MPRAMESIMCSGEKRKKTAHSIFRSIKIWFLLQMKTIGPYNVAVAWGHLQNQTHTTNQWPAELSTGRPYQVGKRNRVVLIQKMETGRPKERKRKYKTLLSCDAWNSRRCYLTWWPKRKHHALTRRWSSSACDVYVGLWDWEILCQFPHDYMFVVAQYVQMICSHLWPSEFTRFAWRSAVEAEFLGKKIKSLQSLPTDTCNYAD